MNNRAKYIDVAKGIGIILVVLGHLNVSGQLNREMIYAFHMPFFFLISGLFAGNTKKFKDYFSGLIKRLYLPFVIFTVLDIVMQLALRLNDFTASEYVKKSALALVGWDFKFIVNRPLWFLFSLFIIKAVYYFIRKSNILKLLVIVAGFSFLFFGDKYFHGWNNLYLISLPGLSFFVIGSFCKPCMNGLQKTLEKRPYIFVTIIIIAFALLAYTAHYNGAIDMAVYRYGASNWLYIFNSLLGSFIVLSASVYISKVKLLSKPIAFFGVNSIVVVMCHYVLCRKITPLLFKYLDLSDYLYNFYVELGLTLAVLAVDAVLIFVFNRYLYFMLGMLKPSKVINKPKNPV